MFNRCAQWRNQINLRAENGLSMKQRWDLIAHLDRCDCCRALVDADVVFSETLLNSVDEPLIRAENFADGVVRGVRLDLNSPRGSGSEPIGGRAPYVTQLVFGALAAGLITSVAVRPLLGALSHPHVASDITAVGVATGANVRRADSSVPLDSILRSRSPRAALMWSAPPAAKPLSMHKKTPRAVAPPPLPEDDGNGRLDDGLKIG